MKPRARREHHATSFILGRIACRFGRRRPGRLQSSGGTCGFGRSVKYRPSRKRGGLCVVRRHSLGRDQRDGSEDHRPRRGDQDPADPRRHRLGLLHQSARRPVLQHDLPQCGRTRLRRLPQRSGRAGGVDAVRPHRPAQQPLDAADRGELPGLPRRELLHDHHEHVRRTHPWDPWHGRRGFLHDVPCGDRFVFGRPVQRVRARDRRPAPVGHGQILAAPRHHEGGVDRGRLLVRPGSRLGLPVLRELDGMEHRLRPVCQRRRRRSARRGHAA